MDDCYRLDECYRHAKRDLFFAVFRASSADATGCRASPASDVARRSTSWETWASRFDRKNGTPRFKAYTTLRPSETIEWSTLRPIECSTSVTRIPRVESARFRTRRTLPGS